jgi:glycosyltransferase involved in cell wall biosynthesis
VGLTSAVSGTTAVDASIKAILDTSEEIEIILLTLSTLLREVRTEKFGNISIIGVPERPSARSKILSLFSVERNFIAAEISTLSFDRILVHWIYEYALAIPKTHVKKTILVIHDSPIRVTLLAPSWMRIAKVVMAVLARVKLHEATFVSVSRYTAHQIRRELFLFRRIELLPNVLSVAKTTDVSKKQPFTILCIANDSDLKDVSSLINAHLALKTHFPSLLTRIVGPGLDSKSNLATNTGFIQDIEWMGAMNSSEVFDLIRESYVVVSCSKEESFGLTCLEALYLGTRFVSRNPLPSFMDIGAGNPLFISSTPGAFLRDLEFFLTSPYVESTISESRLIIESKYGPTSYLRRLKSLLNAK